MTSLLHSNNNHNSMSRTDWCIHYANRLHEKIESASTQWLTGLICCQSCDPAGIPFFPSKALAWLIGGIPYLIIKGIATFLIHQNNRHTIELGDLGNPRLPNRDYTLDLKGQVWSVTRHPFGYR